MKAILNGVTYTAENFAAPPSAVFSNDLIGDQLQADMMTVDIITGTSGDGYILTADGEILTDADGNVVVPDGETYVPPIGVPTPAYGDEITLYGQGDVLVCKMYVDSVERVAREVYRITAVSAVGLLISRFHYGGIYNGETASDILAEIFGNIPYSVGDLVGAEQIYGHLPAGSARDNLHILLQALGASVLKDANGDVLIDYIDTTAVRSVPASETDMASGSVRYPAKATSVTVVEHAFLQTANDETETLFDNTNDLPASGEVVLFRDPCYDLVAVGLTVTESGANYAIVTGVGTLTGKVYTHTREERTEATGALGLEKSVAVRENELINTLNSSALLERLVNYYGAANRASVSVKGSDIRTGHHLVFTNIYGEETDGFVEEAEATLSVGLDKSDITVATDYLPGPFGNDYDSFLIIDEAGQWSVPAELTGQKVKVCVFGGARGGQAGYNGANGDLFFGSVGKSGAGGDGGAGGQGFKLHQQEIDLTEASYLVTIGTGGAGGASNGALGSLGGDTSFGAVSSADGAEVVQYLNIISGGVYGIKGAHGVAGNPGGVIGESVKYIETWHDGLNTASISWPIPYSYGEPGTVYGGCGGGAAMGANGGDAYSIQPPNSVYEHGGDGATATIVPLQADGYAEGGDGGHGGGGGGASGGYKFDSGGSASGGAGNGGAGSAGGQGADGFVLIFYHS